MRKSTRIKNALTGVVGATALTGGASAVAAAPASAATASTATPWHGVLRGIAASASTRARGLQAADVSTVYALSIYDGLRKTRVTLRLRYSLNCQSEWADVKAPAAPTAPSSGCTDRGSHALEVASTERATFTRQWETTKMVGVAKTKAQACIEVHDPHGMKEPLCTPFTGH